MGQSTSKPDDARVSGTSMPWLCAVRLAEPSDKLFIFDWDDTLLCSSAINMQQSTPEQLQELETAAETVLRLAMSRGETLIVTNGNQSWVQDSSRRFFPRLVPLLSRLRVMSARAAYEKSWPGQPFAWKKAAFQEILSDHQSSELTPTRLNLIVLGDSLAEIEAVHHAKHLLRGPALVKTIKFKEFPSIEELTGELRIVTDMLPDIVSADTSCDKALVLRPLPLHLEYMTSLASGWKVIDHMVGSPIELGSRSPIELGSPVTLAGG